MLTSNTASHKFNRDLLAIEVMSGLPPKEGMSWHPGSIAELTRMPSRRPRGKDPPTTYQMHFEDLRGMLSLSIP